MSNNKYERKFLDIASKLDAINNACGEISKIANEYVTTKDELYIKEIVKIISDISNDIKAERSVKQFANLLKDSLVEYCGYVTVKKACDDKVETVEDDERTLEELLRDLNEMVGLVDVKQRVNNLIAYETIQQLRRNRGFNSTKNTLHMAFMGNPGTGKTTVARIVGHVYKQIGLLSRGHFVEVSRTDLIAGYQGQTALKVKKVIESAIGGVLFIDEAYSITENDHSDSYGRECITELTKALEDYRDNLVVIVAGYTEPMKFFFDSNPGLKSRFNTFIEFPDYTSMELSEILDSICKKNDYKMEDNLRMLINQYFLSEVEKKVENFANGRLSRNVFDDLVMNHAKRVIQYSNPTDEDLTVLKKEDFVVQSPIFEDEEECNTLLQ